MCTPQTPKQILKDLTLDNLALLARHRRATPGVLEAFSRALSDWTDRRIRHLSVRYPSVSNACREDIRQDFLIRCLRRHLQTWRSSQCSFTAFAYRRLHGDVVDHLRRRITAERRAASPDLDLDTFEDDNLALETITNNLQHEHQLRLLEGGLRRLPSREREVLERTAEGESMSQMALEEGVHPSTLSRLRATALTNLREEVLWGPRPCIEVAVDTATVDED